MIALITAAQPLAIACRLNTGNTPDWWLSQHLCFSWSRISCTSSLICSSSLSCGHLTSFCFQYTDGCYFAHKENGQIDIWTHLEGKGAKEQTYSTQTVIQIPGCYSQQCHLLPQVSQLITASQRGVCPVAWRSGPTSSTLPVCALTAVSACSPDVLAVVHMSLNGQGLRLTSRGLSPPWLFLLSRHFLGTVKVKLDFLFSNCLWRHSLKLIY